MKVYFDLANLLSFIHSAGDKRYADCIRMLIDNFDLHFSFSSNDIMELDKDNKEDVKMWIRSMDSLKSEIVWNEAFPNKELKLKDCSKDALECVYFLSPEKTSKIIDNNILLVAKVGDEIGTLTSLFVDGNQYSDNIFNRIEDWSDIESYVSPCTDIIIVDKYILSSPDLYTNNLFSLLKTLSKKAVNAKLKIVLFVPTHNYNRETKVNFEPDWDGIYEKIRKDGKKFKPNVTFVTMNEQLFDEHDRTIFTNYKLIDSGDTFNYFLSSGEKCTKGRWLHVNSKAKKSFLEDSRTFINDLQEIIKDIESKNNPELIKKDRKCNFLDFAITTK